MKKLLPFICFLLLVIACESEDDDSTTENISSSTQALISPSPLIDTVSPTSGSTAGGEAVAIFGVSFTDDTSVFFGESACQDLQVISSVEIQCKTPAERAGYINVTVTSSAGSETKESLFQYIEPDLSLVITTPESLPSNIGTHDVESRTLRLEHEGSSIQCAIDDDVFAECTSSDTYVIPVSMAAPGHVIKVKVILEGTDDVVQTVSTDDIFTDVTVHTCSQTIADDLTFSEFSTVISNSTSGDTLCFAENVIIENNDTIADNTITVTQSINLIGTALNQIEMNGMRDSGGGSAGNSLFILDGAHTMNIDNVIIRASGSGGSAFSHTATAGSTLNLRNVELSCETSDGILTDYFSNILVENSVINQLTVGRKIFKGTSTTAVLTITTRASELESIGDTPIDLNANIFALNLNMDKMTLTSRAPLIQLTAGATKNVVFDDTTLKVTGGGFNIVQSGSLFNPGTTINGNFACNSTGGAATNIFNLGGDFDMTEWVAENTNNTTVPACP